MHSIAEVRTWLLDCATELFGLERRLDLRTRRATDSSKSSDELNGSLSRLKLRLGLISQLLSAERDGVALVSAEQQLFDLMLTAHMDRLRLAVDRLKRFEEHDSTQNGPELPLEPPATTPDA